MRLAFLVYDSRSGSTLLSKKIVEGLNDVVVTPEVTFNRIIKADKIARWPSDLPAFMEEQGVNNFRLRSQEMKEFLARNGKDSLDPCSAIRLMLEGYVKGLNLDFSPKWVIVKGGRNLFIWRKIVRCFGDEPRWIFVYRDPRGVISSKLRTRRSYRSNESMAWGGELIAAIRWYQYSATAERVKNSGSDLLEVSYEDLLKGHEAVLERIGSFLGVTSRKGISMYKYIIPEKEKKMHPLVESGKVVSKRAEAWKRELTNYQISVIESALSGELLRRGYILTIRRPWHFRIAFVFSALPKNIFLVLKHFLKKC